VIRFQCAHCDKRLKAPEGKAGATVVCPRCERLCMIPSETDGSDPARPGGLSPGASPRQSEEAPSLFSGMSLGLRVVLGLVAAVGLLSLLLAVVPLSSVPDTVTYGAVPLVPISAIAALAILYGHGTSCPSCGKWWAREEVGKEFVEREEFAKQGAPFARSIYRVRYHCETCGHAWSATSTEEFKRGSQNRTRPRLG
jgi:phage FluMu protein Com